MDSAGNLYVSNGNTYYIEKITPSGVGSVFASGGGLGFPIGLACDSADNLYVASGGGSIFKYTPAGQGSIFANEGLNGVMGLAIDNAGNVYAANYSGNSIYEFAPNGVGRLLANTAGGSPMGLAIQPVPEPSGATLVCLGLMLRPLLRTAITQKRRKSIRQHRRG